MNKNILQTAFISLLAILTFFAAAYSSRFYIQSTTPPTPTIDNSPIQTAAVATFIADKLIIYPTARFTPYQSRTPRTRPSTEIPFLHHTPLPTLPFTNTPLSSNDLLIPTYTTTPSITPTTVCTCTANTLNCDNFGSQSEAQLCFDNCMIQTGKDIHRLDRNKDKIACNE